MDFVTDGSVSFMKSLILIGSPFDRAGDEVHEREGIDRFESRPHPAPTTAC